MRIGENPARHGAIDLGYRLHRVIVPVYLPEQAGFYEHMLTNLRQCMESLWLSTKDTASVTVIVNQSTPELMAELTPYLERGWIDQLTLNEQNRGKVDAALSVARGVFEPLITLADCDVLFRPGWLEAVHELFCTFPECGVASPAPDPLLTSYYTSATVLAALARGEVGFAKVVPDEYLERFSESVCRPDRYTAEQKASQMIVRRQGVTAAVGCGHYVLTMRREVVQRLPHEPSMTALGGNSEARWLDFPPDVMGVWRLAAPPGFAHHMGNSPEPWMAEALESYRRESRPSEIELAPIPKLRLGWPSKVPWRLREAVAYRLRKSRLGAKYYERLARQGGAEVNDDSANAREPQCIEG